MDSNLKSLPRRISLDKLRAVASERRSQSDERKQRVVCSIVRTGWAFYFKGQGRCSDFKYRETSDSENIK